MYYISSVSQFSQVRLCPLVVLRVRDYNLHVSFFLAIRDGLSVRVEKALARVSSVTLAPLPLPTAADELTRDEFCECCVVLR